MTKPLWLYYKYIHNMYNQFIIGKFCIKSYVTSIHLMSCIQRTQNSEVRGLLNIILKERLQ